MVITGEHLAQLASVGRYGTMGPMEARSQFVLGERQQAQMAAMRRGRIW
jgi:hypothetical protein